MNITSYEISKQLHDAGFRAESQTLIHPMESVFGEKYLAYDLETLIKELPKPISIGLDGILVRVNSQVEPVFAIFRSNESMADSAARLLLQLIKIKQI